MTLFENTSFFSSEGQSLEVDPFHLVQGEATEVHSSPSSIPVPLPLDGSEPSSQVPSSESSSPPSITVPQEQPLQVYTRRNVKDVLPTSTQLTHQSPSTSTDPPCISNPADDTNVPIAIRKGKRSCTHNPIYHFVSFANLSSTYRNLALSLSST